MKLSKKSNINRKKSVWEGLPWKPVDTANENLGDFEEAVFFSLEELDGDYCAVNKSSGGLEIVSHEKDLSKSGINDSSSSTNFLSSDQTAVDNAKTIKKKTKVKRKAIEKLRLMATKQPSGTQAEICTEPVPEVAFFDKQWGNMTTHVRIHSLLESAVMQLKFFVPTPVQCHAIPLILRGDCDLVGAAETGSGKTLAFGLPVLHRLFWDWNENIGRDCPYALAIAPTRELAMQIAAVLRSICELPEVKACYKVNVVTVVGGMSEHKQRRQLCSDRRPVHILVATPGRLAELLTNDADVTGIQNLSKIRFLVVDEVDRMIEEGHFPELQKIFQVIVEHQKIVASGRIPSEVKLESLRGVDETETEVEVEAEEVEETDDNDNDNENFSNHPQSQSHPSSSSTATKSLPVTVPVSKRQTLLFSATALKSAQKATTLSKKRKRSGPRLDKRGDSALINSLPPGLKEMIAIISDQRKLEVVDVTAMRTIVTTPSQSPSSSGDKEKDKKEKPTNASASTSVDKNTSSSTPTTIPSSSFLQLPTGLEQFEMSVPIEEKDVMAYYVLAKHPGRTLVFVNSIKAARRLDGLLRALGMPCRALHAQQQQKQRLKALEAFRDAPRSILVATDVAARGLDIPAVQTVLHYDVSRTAQLYQHRSGRTARAGKGGVTISLVSPEDSPYHTAICTAQNLRHVSPFKVNLAEIPPLREKVLLAKKIFTTSFVEAQKTKQKSWLEQTAKEMGIEPDEDLAREEEWTEGDSKRRRALQKDRQRLRQLMEGGPGSSANGNAALPTEVILPVISSEFSKKAQSYRSTSYSIQNQVQGVWLCYVPLTYILVDQEQNLNGIPQLFTRTVVLLKASFSFIFSC
eukprot:gene9559-19860_t